MRRRLAGRRGNPQPEMVRRVGRREPVGRQDAVYQALRVRGRVERPVVVERIGQEAAAAAARVADASPCAARRHERVAPEVRLEVDRQVVALPSPGGRLCGRRPQRRPGPFAGEPRHIERFHRIDRRHAVRERRVPASDHQPQLRIRQSRPDGGDCTERHQKVTDPLETKQQHASGWRFVVRCGLPPSVDRRPGGQCQVGRAHEPALVPAVDLQMLEHV